MKAVYCYALESFFKVVPDDFAWPEGELGHIARSEWKSFPVPDDFDGNVSHYFLDASTQKMYLLPESEWPENQADEEPV